MPVSVIWRRGKSELESKAGLIDPKTGEAKIDDIFKMKTSLEFDINKATFVPKPVSSTPRPSLLESSVATVSRSCRRGHDDAPSLILLILIRRRFCPCFTPSVATLSQHDPQWLA